MLNQQQKRHSFCNSQLSSSLNRKEEYQIIPLKELIHTDFHQLYHKKNIYLFTVVTITNNQRVKDQVARSRQVNTEKHIASLITTHQHHQSNLKYQQNYPVFLSKVQLPMETISKHIMWRHVKGESIPDMSNQKVPLTTSQATEMTSLKSQLKKECQLSQYTNHPFLIDRSMGPQPTKKPSNNGKCLSTKASDINQQSNWHQGEMLTTTPLHS